MRHMTECRMPTERAGCGVCQRVTTPHRSGFGLTESVSPCSGRRVPPGPRAHRVDTVPRIGCGVQLGALGVSAGGRGELTDSVSTARFDRGPRVQSIRPTDEPRRSRPGCLDTYRVCESVRTESGALLAGMSRVLATGAPIRSVLSASLTQSERTRGVKWLGSESREWA